MTVRELREKYLAFFESKGHRRFPSGSLIPYDVTGRLDESLLFNGAGMIQFKPYFRGVAKPDHPRLTTVQKCVRTGDIDEVGDATHLTFFEMLGNFSFGDYFKTEAIRFSWEFLTSPQWLGLDPARLSFTVFAEDDEAESAWRECGATRVYRLGEDTNYWPAGAFSNGPPGPCGPNSEMFYWTAPEAPPSGGYSVEDWLADEAEGKWVEIWNDVFIQFEWQGIPADRGYVKTGMPELPFRSIDTGMGLERTAMVLSGESDVYATDAFTGILAAIGKVRGGIVPIPRIPTVPVGEEPEVRKVQSKHLPHWTQDGATYFVTFRLADSVPASKREEWRIERERLAMREAAGALTENERHAYRRAFRDEIDGYLDAGVGECLLKDASVARSVADALTHFDGERYDLLAYVVMPNHVHAIVRPRDGFALDKILHSWKSFTAHEINRLLGRTGDVWMDESYDHIVRSDAELDRLKTYVAENPVRAGLAPEGRIGGVLLADRDGRDTGDRDDPTTIRATKIVADHVRTATFCIADGVLPSNNGRGYVLRRLVRRAVLKGSRDLNAPEGFFATIAETVIDEYGSVYPELREQRTVVLETLRNEEALFRRTLKAGTERLGELLTADISGEDAFRLYDTFGFPLEVTKELAAEAGVSVDEDGYAAALKEAQARSRGADERESVYGGVGGATVHGDPAPTEFLGYDALEADAAITGVKVQGDRVWIALDRTPFYAESGGQAGDSGVVGSSRSRVSVTVSVASTTKVNGVYWHEIQTDRDGRDTGDRDDPTTLLGLTVRATVDADRRRRTEPHHTGTHLLHLALREELGDHATQAGSAVGPDRLRFDFTHGAALTDDQRERIETRVNELARANYPVVTHVDLTPAEAKERGAMALFGEKYGDRVRMVEIGPSKELCGGTHVTSSAEVFPFRIVAEASAQSGVRRIEAVAGAAALESYREETRRLRETATALKARPTETVEAVARLQTELKEERTKREKAERAALGGGAKAIAEEAIGPIRLLVLDLGEIDPKTGQALVDEKAANRPELVVVAGMVAGGKVLFAAKAGAAAVAAGAHSGEMLKAAARVAGGGGGGRAEFATAGGKDPAKVAEALAAARVELATRVAP